MRLRKSRQTPSYTQTTLVMTETTTATTLITTPTAVMTAKFLSRKGRV